jgi:hypothetical protein
MSHSRIKVQSVAVKTGACQHDALQSPTNRPPNMNAAIHGTGYAIVVHDTPSAV